MKEIHFCSYCGTKLEEEIKREKEIILVSKYIKIIKIKGTNCTKYKMKYVCNKCEKYYKTIERI